MIDWPFMINCSEVSLGATRSIGGGGGGGGGGGAGSSLIDSVAVLIAPSVAPPAGLAQRQVDRRRCGRLARGWEGS